MTADVQPDGTIRSVEDHAYANGAWRDIGGLRSLGVTAFTGAELLKLQHRLASDPVLRTKFASLYDGGVPFEITEDNWLGYWCAATFFGGADYRHCVGERGIKILTQRGILIVAAGIATLALLLVGGILSRARRGSGRRSIS